MLKMLQSDRTRLQGGRACNDPRVRRHPAYYSYEEFLRAVGAQAGISPVLIKSRLPFGMHCKGLRNPPESTPHPKSMELMQVDTCHRRKCLDCETGISPNSVEAILERIAVGIADERGSR